MASSWLGPLVCRAPRVVVAANGAVEDPAEFAARAEIALIKASVTDKATWAAKIYDDAIVEKWLQEALHPSEHRQRGHRQSGHSQPAPPPDGEALAGLFRQAIAELRASRYFHRFGVAYEDGLVGPELRDALRSQLSALAAAMRPDWHPGSGETVLDLIHPSLFPFVSGRSFISGRTSRMPYWVQPLPLNGRPAYEGSPRDRFAHCVLGDEEQSMMQWLPAEVDVNAAGEARFASYINNLPAPHPLYDTLAQVFSHVLPLLEDVVTSPNAPTRVSLRGRRLQVIVKAANYVLGQGRTYEGSWHVEGMQHERIVATAVYYYDQRGAIGANGIRFRRLRNRHIAGHRIQGVTEQLGQDCGDEWGRWVTQATDDAPYTTHPEESGEVDLGNGEPKIDEEDPSYEVPTGYTVPRYWLGNDATDKEHLKDRRHMWLEEYKAHSVRNFVDLDAIATPEGRVLVFKNSLLHQVQRLYNAGAGVAERRMLLFWLVHPDFPIVSTADVPPQQWEDVAPALAVALALRLGRSAQLAWRVLRFAQWGFRRAEAEALRTQLMQERAGCGSKVGKLFTSSITREYSFCEH